MAESKVPGGETPQSGSVKWFNKQRGYGFIIPSNGTKDFLVHAKVVRKSGVANLCDGDRVVFVGEEVAEGRRVSQILEVDTSTRRSRSPAPSPRHVILGEPIYVEVKWFDSGKGYGFLIASDGGPDIFLHQSTVRAYNCRQPQKGDWLHVRTRQGSKGPVVVEIL